VAGAQLRRPAAAAEGAGPGYTFLSTSAGDLHLALVSIY